MKKGFTKAHLRKEARKLSETQLRSYYASMHSKTGQKAINRMLKFAGESISVGDIKKILKEEMERRKKEKKRKK